MGFYIFVFLFLITLTVAQSTTTPQPPIVDTKFIISLSICGGFFCMILIYALHTYRLRYMKRRAREAKQKEKTMLDKLPEIL